MHIHTGGYVGVSVGREYISNASTVLLTSE